MHLQASIETAPRPERHGTRPVKDNAVHTGNVEPRDEENCTILQPSRDERQATALAMLRAFVAALTCRAGHSLGGVCGYFDAHIVTSGHSSVVHRVNASAHDHMVPGSNPTWGTSFREV